MSLRSSEKRGNVSKRSAVTELKLIYNNLLSLIWFRYFSYNYVKPQDFIYLPRAIFFVKVSLKFSFKCPGRFCANS